MGCVCLCVGYAFSHFLDFDDATAILRFPPTRMQPPTDFTPFFVFFRLYINTLIGGFLSVCLSVCVSVCVLVTLFRIFWISTMQQRFYGSRLLACSRQPISLHFSFFFRLYINTIIGGFPFVCLCVGTPM